MEKKSLEMFNQTVNYEHESINEVLCRTIHGSIPPFITVVNPSGVEPNRRQKQLVLVLLYQSLPCIPPIALIRYSGWKANHYKRLQLSFNVIG